MSDTDDKSMDERSFDLDDTLRRLPRPELSQVMLRKFLVTGVENDASTIYIFPGAAVTYRIGAKLLKVADSRITADQTLAFTAELVPPELYPTASYSDKIRWLTGQRCVDFSYSITGVSRFRVHVFRQRGSLALTIRITARDIPDLKKYAMPESFYQLIKTMNNGLIVVYGRTRGGKSSLLAAMVDYLNKTQSRLILILEQASLFSHPNQSSLITQRELRTDVETLAEGIEEALRQDQDVIVIDDFGDAEALERVVDAVMKGMLVIMAVGAPEPEKVIQQLVNLRPPNRQIEFINDLQTHLKVLVGVETIITQIGRREVRTNYQSPNTINALLLARKSEFGAKREDSVAGFDEMGAGSSVGHDWYEGD